MLLKRGAEAELRKADYLGRPAVEKYRVPKSYRLASLDDQLRRTRIRTETRLMAEARAAGVSVPVLYDIDLVANRILMEFVEGPTAKDVLDAGGAEAHRVATEIGRIAGRLHRHGIVHGDLTTSNMIVRDSQVVMIDFSLGAKDERAEARGVDLHLLREALTSAHRNATAYYRDVLFGYREILGPEARPAIFKVREIEERGRYS